MERYRYIDIAKGIGIFCVVASHTYPVLSNWSNPFFVPLFFVLSGICTTKPVSIQKKAKSLLIPYFVFSFLLFVLSRRYTLLDFGGIFYSRFCLLPVNSIDNVYFMTMWNSPLWFLTCMFIAFLLFIPFQKINNRTYRILLAIGYILITRLLENLPILLPWSIDTAFLMAFFIYIGTIIKKKEILRKIPIWAFIAMLGLYFFLYTYCGKTNVSVRLFGWSLWLMIPAALIGSALVVKVSEWLSPVRLSSILEEIGKYSLFIFCLHMPVITLFLKGCSLLSIDPNSIASGIAKTIICIIVPYLLAKGWAGRKYLLSKTRMNKIRPSL